MDKQLYYKRHIFFCCNQKADGSGCGNFGGEAAFTYTRDYLKEHDLWGEGKLRATLSKCLGRCELNPVCVIYPEGAWYTYVNQEDVRQIIEEHLCKGNIVNSLLI